MAIPESVLAHKDDGFILQFDPAEAQDIGLPGAIILNQIRYWLRPHPNVKPSRWVYNSYPMWQEQFPFWSESTIRRTLTDLEDKGIIVSEMREVSRGFCCKYYRLGDQLEPEGYAEREDPLSNLSTPSGQSDHAYKESETPPKTTAKTPSGPAGKRPKRQEEPELLQLAGELHSLIETKMREEGLLTGNLKLNLNATARELRLLRDTDKFPITELPDLLTWAWGHSWFSRETGRKIIYGAVLTSPLRWREHQNGDPRSKIQKALAQYNKADDESNYPAYGNDYEHGDTPVA